MTPAIPESALYLSTLHPALADQLADLMRELDGMSEQDRAYAIAIVAEVSLHFALRPINEENDRFIPGADLIARLGTVIHLANNLSTAPKETDS